VPLDFSRRSSGSPYDGDMKKALAYLSRTWALPADTVRLEPIQGGLESRVLRGQVTTDGAGLNGLPSRFVVKELRGVQRRELSIYRSIWKDLPAPPAARLLGVHRDADADYLLLEDVTPACDWPWRDHEAAAAVCRELARLHDAPSLSLPDAAWDYEAELAASAGTTLDLALTLAGADGRRAWRRTTELRRVVESLPAIRQRLLGTETAVLHGDVHPGNVMVCEGERRPVALIDWARARRGSPLEDIASWLHSLGCWEPESRRRHDSLVQAYLAARSVPHSFTRRLREDYWLASACNGLSGAIRYNLAVVADPQASDAARAQARHALNEWQRLIRGAATILRRESAR
jgi:aminoglycoside phosphotransferase (APT) family kinase protein